MVTPSTTPSVVVISTVNPVPEPPEVVAKADPFAYPVPPALIAPRVFTPSALALVIVIVSSIAYPDPAALIATLLTAPPDVVRSNVSPVPPPPVVARDCGF